MHSVPTQKIDQEGLAGLKDINYIIVKTDVTNKALFIFSPLGTGLTKS